MSDTAIATCRELYSSDPSKKFLMMSEWSGDTADVALSLDVNYHLIEDDVYCAYTIKLFASSKKFVITYSSNFDSHQSHHERHRRFGDWVTAHAPAFHLLRHDKNKYPYSENDPDNTSFADFFVYSR